MTQTPTDALRLVPVEPTEAMLQAGADALFECSPVYNDETRAHMKMMAHTSNIHRAKRCLSAMLAAAPASPLPGGGDMDWQDKAEGLESDLRQAVLVAWKRGAEEWCRLNYPQWVEWLEACHAPAAPTGEPK